MSKVPLNNLVNLTNQTTAVNTINGNNATITTAFDNTLSRDGTSPNQMASNLDMNSFQILNLPTPLSGNSPARLQDLATITGGGTVQSIPSGGTTNQVLAKNSNTSYDVSWVSAGSGTVTNVGLVLPADFTVTNSPVTTTGNLTGAWATTPTGSGAVVRATSPTLVTPTLGVASATTINGNAITSGTGTLTLGSNTLTANNTGNVVTSATAAGGDLTGTMPNPTIAANAVTNAKAAQMAAYTIKGNATGSTANATDISIPALTQKVSPAAGDFVMIADSAASNALKYVTASSLASIGSVSSIAGNTGAFTLSHGLTNSTNDLRADVSVHQSYLVGLIMSTAGSSSTFSVGAGVAVDGGNNDWMKVASSINKTTSGWAVGSGSGSLDTGSIANSTWYHVFVIKRTDTGVVDILTSLSVNAPTMPTSYTLFRRIGAMKTDGSANWTAFSQNGDEFLWSTPVTDVSNATLNNSVVNPVLSVPTGLNVNVLMHGVYNNTAATTSCLFYSGVLGTLASSGATASLYLPAASQFVAGDFNVRTDTAGRIKAVGSSASGGAYYVSTYGWVDRRGRDF